MKLSSTLVHHHHRLFLPNIHHAGLKIKINKPKSYSILYNSKTVVKIETTTDPVDIKLV